MRELLCLLFLGVSWLPISARVETAPSAVPSVAVRMVHPDSLKPDREGKPAPEGYTPYMYEFRDRRGKIQRQRLFLKDAPSSRRRTWNGRGLIQADRNISTLR